MNYSETAFSSEYHVLDHAQSDVMRVLLYFDVFNYPLTLEEIFLWSGGARQTDTQNAVASLLHGDFIGCHNGKYFLSGRHDSVQLREDLNNRALQFYARANHYTKLISNFPFVRGVLVTGSLSKGCMEKNGDIDYLIITKPGRLWLCRAFLTLYKKTVLFNSRKYFCVNYYLDEESLHIPDHNLFTATEIASAGAAFNKEICQSFFEANAWIKEYYPNIKHEAVFTVHQPDGGLWKQLLEKLFEAKAGDVMDEWMMRLFVGHWRAKFRGEDKSRFEVNFRSRKNVSKHHPHGFQFKVLQAYERNVDSFEQRHNVKLS